MNIEPVHSAAHIFHKQKCLALLLAGISQTHTHKRSGHRSQCPELKPTPTATATTCRHTMRYALWCHAVGRSPRARMFSPSNALPSALFSLSEEVALFIICENYLFFMCFQFTIFCTSSYSSVGFLLRDSCPHVVHAHILTNNSATDA